MALSDQLSKLSQQAKSLEDAVSSFNADTHEKMAERRDAAKKSLDETRARADAKASAGAAAASASWARFQQSVSSDFDHLHDEIAEKRAKHAAERADHRADSAESDAEDAIDFAVYALQEAEYAVLDAAYYRDEAMKMQQTE
jgi:hypothetical protein